MKERIPQNLVLCEGREDCLVMQALAHHAGLAGALSFQDYGGETNLRRYLATLKVSPEFVHGEYARILVTRDADLNFAAAWTSVAAAVKAVFAIDLSEPDEWMPCAEGTRLAAWIVPGPGQTGMIETLCLDAAKSGSPDMFRCLDPFIECLARSHGAPPHEKIRFALWTIIAQGSGAQDRLSLERALAKLALDWDNAAFAPLKALLVGLVAGH